MPAAVPPALPVPWLPEAAARRCGWAPSYIVELDGKGGVRAYDLNERTPVEPLVAVMDLDDDAAERRQQEAREAAVGRLWARDRWGR